MNCSRFSFRFPSARRWGLALMLGIASAVAPHAGRAQVVTPTPYQSPLFHAGGAPANAADGTGLLPLYSQLQGTPTGLFPAGASGVSTQIPSFLLGAYDPLRPPSTIGTYYPDHFADGSIYSWSAPFVFIPQSASTVTVDDSFGAPTAGPPPTSGFTVSPTAGGFVPTTGAPGTPGDLPAATATGGEYYRLSPSTSGTATWTLVASAAGSYSLYFHIPDNIADSAGAIEARSNLVQYVVKTSGAFAQTQTATVSQTEANSAQFLAGPFQLAQYDTVTVTLQRDATHNQTTTADYLIADSMTLQASIGDVQSTPTAINASAFPTDFAGANLKYWGIYVAPSTTGVQATGSTTGGDNAPPDTTGGAAPSATKVLHYGFGNTASTQPDGTPVDANHRIRQLVFFGRQEPSTGSAVRVDDSSGTPSFTTPTGTWNHVTYVAGPPVVNPGAASATNLEYLVTGAANGGSNATAQWTLTAPGNGAYFLSVHLPGLNTGEKRITDAAYGVTVTRAGAVISTTTTTLSQATQFGDVLLPSGSLPLLAGDVVTVTLGNGTGNTGATGLDVVADSITLTSGTGHGAIYCVDGFNGAVVWRYETAASAAGASAPVFSSPAVVKINVMTSPGDPNAGPAVPPTYENKLVVIVGDNSGLVYCLDAIGHGDGTSNSQAVDPNTGQPITLPQPGYGTLGASPINPAGRPAPVDANGYAPHVGTTNAYWVYRPDATLPKDLTTKAPRLDPADPTHKRILRLPDRDLPVPVAFGTASPTVFVDPSVAPAAAGTTYTTPPTNATVYVGNSNGVLYALDAVGVPYSTKNSTTDPAYPYGDTFNVSQDIRRARNVFPPVATDAVAPTCQPRWWFTLRGGNASLATSASAADFESAPALHITAVSNGATPPVIGYTPRVFIGSAHEQESTSNVGRLYALNGLLGPAGNGGRNLVPGTLNYNVAQRPQTSPTDTADWSFPDAYGTDTYTTGLSSNKKPRPALGNITGSPVVFTDVNEGTAARKTRVYFAANVGLEVPKGSTGKTPAPRPDAAQTGRIWAVNLDGSVGTTTGTTAATSTATMTNAWAYPSAWDPNDATKDTSPEPSTPIGAFLHATPSIGVVQFPLVISNGDATSYGHTDASGNDVKGRSVPMLYVASRGVNDTALYALDIDGKDDSTASTTTAPAGADKLIYRQISPDGAIYQSSPALVTNYSTSGGNGGAVFITAGNTLYDFSATPISNPIPTEAFPLVRENRAFTGFGSLSSPTLSAADTTDLPVTTTTATNPTAFAYPTNAVDWVYCGDTSTGLCHGITPYDTTYAGQTNLGGILPADFGGVSTIDLSSALRSYLVSDASAASTNYGDRLDKTSNALPVYEWGQNVYIRFANVVPPFPTQTTGGVPSAQPTDPRYFLRDQNNTTPASAANPLQVYGNGGPVEFDLSDTTSSDPADHATVPARIVTALPGDGFILRGDTDTDNNLVTSEATGRQWIGAYTYAIGDGSARRNTPGGQRQVINARQIVHVFTTTDGTTFTDTGKTVTLAASTTNGGPKSVVDSTTGNSTFGPNPIQPVEQPKFGILNPIGLRAGGLPLSLNNTPVTNAAEIGDEVGPFRGIKSNMQPLLDGTDPLALEALANGNDIPVAAPTSTTGGGKKGIGNPTQRPAAAVAAPTTTHHTVVTATGLIPHNGGGDNSDFSTLAPPTGTLGNADPRGLSATNFGSPDQPYAADVFDRSALGLVGKSLSLKMYTPNGAGGGLFWNDNTQNTTGHDSVVNFLPWETPPATYRVGQANTSPDYPDIASQNVTAALYPQGGGGGDLGSDGVTPTVATPGATLQGRTVYASPLQVHVSVPHYQPANQQLYDKTTAGGGYSAVGEISPSGIVSASDTVFPMGYVTTKRIYAANISGRFQDGTAYRDIRVYTGVPIDMSTSIANPTTDIGKVPGAFGIQVSQYPGYKDAAANIGFTPYNATFAQNYQPVTANNNGNVNLLNVHFDQLYAVQGPNNTPVSTPLSLVASALDPLSAIPAYDAAGVTGPRSDTFNSVSELPFLLRSSLDPDLAAAYGINPSIAADATLKAFYPSATFHKPRVGSDTPTVLTVPDVPSVDTAGAPFSLYLTADKPIVVAGRVAAVDNDPHSPTYNQVLPETAPPYVSVGIPFGTPVGTYSQTLRLFEGRDVSGYTTYNTGSKLYNPLYPPQYGGSIGGLAAPTSAPGNVLYPGLQPLSTTGTVVKATVLEDRMTDGYTAGSLPHVDAVPAVPASGSGATAVPAQSTPDFAPAAFRDASSGNLSLYWTSRRSGSYRVQQANVPFNNQNAPGYFSPSDPKNDWWSSGLAPGLVTTGTNSGLTVTPEGSEAFAVNVATPPYANTLYCYPVTASTGALGTAQRVTSDPSQVKYGVKGVFTGAAFGNADPNLWAFWTASTRGRTAIYYNSHTAGAAGDWTQTTGLLPIPAGLTAVADPASVLLNAPVIGTNGTTLQSTLEVTYSGTGPDGGVNLYAGRYQPDATTASKLDPVPFPQVTEILAGQPGGWFQARDVAWSRTGALNLLIGGTPILYSIPASGTPQPLFSRAVFDKTSGLLVLTGVSLTGAVTGGTATVYVDSATGRVRFAGGTPSGQVRATFTPLVRRITVDTRADTGVTTFLDTAQKTNDGPGLTNVEADRRWYFWRKSAVSTDTHSATIYDKTQRLTVYTPTPIAVGGTPAKPVVTVMIGTTDVSAFVDVDYSRGRIYFPINAGGTYTEGQPATVTYTDATGTSKTFTDSVYWQDEIRAGDLTATPNGSADGIAHSVDYAVPIDTVVNENNVAAFLDPYASATNEHKVWLFWNSTRNGTADIYTETINPRFAP